MTAPASRLVLVGGGHAHLGVLADWIRLSPPDAETILVTPHPFALYSGMVPGWIGGRYALAEAQIALAPLCARAGVRLVLDRAVGLDLAGKRLRLGSGQEIGWDLLSIATGSTARPGTEMCSAMPVIPVRPIERLVERLAPGALCGLTVVLGGGAAGVELALALRAAGDAPVTLVAGAQGLLPGLSPAVRRLAGDALRDRGVAIIVADGDGVSGDHLRAGGQRIAAGRIVAATGSGPPDWLAASGLALDLAGFVRVDATQRSVSHPCVFAAGDVARRIDRTLPPSGVHAVFAGPVLAANLRAAILGQASRRCYHPRRWTLYLLSTSDGRAILSWGPLAAHGRWVWRLKDWIDRRFVARFRRLAGSA